MISYRALFDKSACIFNSFKDDIELFWYSDIGSGHGITGKRGYRRISEQDFQEAFTSQYHREFPLNFFKHLNYDDYASGPRLEAEYGLNRLLDLHELDKYKVEKRVVSLIKLG